MEEDIWAKLNLVQAHVSDFPKSDDLETQPAPFKITFANEEAVAAGGNPAEGEVPTIGARDDTAEGPHRPRNWSGQEPVERIVKAILLCAIRDGASDIHIDPQPRAVTVRYRIKGVMRDHLKLPMLVLDPIATRFKLLGKLDPAANAAQWGVIRLRVDERDYDMQISTQPTEFGERIFLRLTGSARH